ncbi:MAG TPA: hypothetical protein VIL65_07945 [Beijerinckiaceae bacterium]|jgi:hypothetical protein
MTSKPRTPQASASPEAAPVPLTPDEAATYVGGIAQELAVIAREAKLELLAYLLDLVREEALNENSAARRPTKG